MFDFSLLFALSLILTAPNGPRGDDGIQEEKTIFTTNVAVDFSGTIVIPGHYIISISNNEMIFSNESNMMVAQKVAVNEESSDKYYHLPHLDILKKSPAVTITYFSQDKLYRAQGVEKADYRIQGRGQVAQATKQDQKVAAPTTKDDYYTDLKATVKKLENQVAHCEDVAIRRNAGVRDEKLTLCVCPIAKKWKLPPPKTLYRKDRHFKKKTHGFSMLIDTNGKVIDCAVWDKKPANPFTQEYVYEGDGTAAKTAPADQ